LGNGGIGALEKAGKERSEEGEKGEK